MEQGKSSLGASFRRAGTVTVPRMLAAMCIAAGVFAATDHAEAKTRRHPVAHSTHKASKSAKHKKSSGKHKRKRKGKRRSASSTSLVLRQAEFKDLPGWSDDNQSEAAIAFNRSCARINLQNPERQFFSRGRYAGKFKDWQPACKAFEQVDQSSPSAVRSFFETMFRPWLATQGGRTTEGLFTGYYQATLHGSRVRTEKYNVPLHLSQPDRANYTRRQILEGNWPHNDAKDVLVWVDDPVDAYFLHVQGSGEVLFEDGTSMFVKYDGDNKKKFRGICLEFMAKGIMTRDTCSLGAIRHWISSHTAEEAKPYLYSDPSYVFFRENPRGGSEGGEGVTLTPQRSLAIDYTKIPYGTPIFLNAQNPDSGKPRLQRLMMAQDTGGAIRGAIRGDFFWGAGLQAEDSAGKMKSRGGYWLLLPKDVNNPKVRKKTAQDVAQQGAIAPETAVPETAVPETAVPETAVPETAVNEADTAPKKAAEEAHSAAHGNSHGRYYRYHPRRHHGHSHHIHGHKRRHPH
jgi:membrane-bound lytic murein transglycosylase A